MNEAPAPDPVSPVESPTPARHTVWRLLGFVVLFMGFQAAWEAARGSWIERLWVHDLTVRSATALINLITPEASAVAEGARIVAPAGVSLSTLAGGNGRYFYAMNYNVLRIKDGMGGLLYSN